MYYPKEIVDCGVVCVGDIVVLQSSELQSLVSGDGLFSNNGIDAPRLSNNRLCSLVPLSIVMHPQDLESAVL